MVATASVVVVINPLRLHLEDDFQLDREELRLFPSREVTALVDLVEVDQVVIWPGATRRTTLKAPLPAEVARSSLVMLGSWREKMRRSRGKSCTVLLVDTSGITRSEGGRNGDTERGREDGKEERHTP